MRGGHVDFYDIRIAREKDGTLVIYPEWIVDNRITDILVNRGAFQAVWDESTGLWSRDEYDLQRLVDADLERFNKEYVEKTGAITWVKKLRNWDTKMWVGLQRYIENLPENRRDLDGKLVFQNTETKKTDYATHRLPYALEPSGYEAWDELVGTLYDEEERQKIEWSIGAVVSGDSAHIQKFLVFYGPPGSGKSTILNIVEWLFDGYTTIFNAKDLTGMNNTFSTAPFKHNPLVAIQHDGDMSKIEDNTLLNTITAHEEISINEKYLKPVSIIPKAFLFIGTNEPVKIRNAKAGVIRRLIDVSPSGRLIENGRYHDLMNKVQFELGGIAHHCLEVYERLGKNFYSNYAPTKMQYQTDFFFNYVESCHDVFKAQDGVSLKQAWEMYKQYCEESGVNRWPMYKFRAELENYFEHVDERATIDGERHRNWYSGYKDVFKMKIVDTAPPYSIELHDFDGESIFNAGYASAPAQYAKDSGFPGYRWAQCNTVLEDLDTKRLHWVKVPENHIVIDFDLVDENGEKDLEQNLAEAAKWPPTYTELSQSGFGVHLHYIYTGDVHELASVYDVGIEVKTLLGDQSLRRKLTKCNDLDIAEISSGLPTKERKVIEEKSMKSEKALRELIERNLRKEIHPGTKPSVDFIHHILEEAYDSGLSYNILDMRPKILAFAAKSSHHSVDCIKVVQTMKFVGKNDMPAPATEDDSPLVFFDVEVYPNLFVVCWKPEGGPVAKMVNPSAQEIEPLFNLKLIGFNNRRYDNHILYGRYLGYDNARLHQLSQDLIADKQSALFGEAYNLSYTDIYDFSSKKQGLKKFQIELGIHHMELDLPWDQPVPVEKWPQVIEYCSNDVISTEAVFESRRQDFVAREILADISGLTVNHTTQQHTARIIFGEDKHPQSKFIYTDLTKEFPGYQFDGKESTYHGEVVGEGGYVYAEPGIYEEVTVLDVASMHPTSIERLNLFGDYTANFSALKEARLAIKRKDYENARSLLGGRLAKHLVDAEDRSDSVAALSYALKIVINIVYGLTSARFENSFRDNRNKDNIVAKRGALFMIDLRQAVQDRGFTVAHIKTDSIKIPNATQEIIDFVVEFGAEYGYEFELEGVYDKFCLVNDAVYIAREGDKWTAVGSQFQHPYVFKQLFTGEEIEFDDLCETRSVTVGLMYLEVADPVDGGTMMVHVGRTGSFVPVLDGGGTLWRVKDDKQYAVAGTKGYSWVQREVAQFRKDNGVLNVDYSYFEHLRQRALDAINNYGSYEQFVER
jgi:energy-coupling factor transporter ATP-binding protein EcfA2